jgi:flagellar basal body rod protein FlgC
MLWLISHFNEISNFSSKKKKKKFKFRKRFMVLKTKNRFSKIKETFTIKLKMISVDHYFCPHQTP